ncbi:hypothetical protein SKAU_G00278380 [Synaphobranchus kaupii]|uniref:Gypsy retrotransposon integrase-like protein 1 n=1 Tax=Synaphobranchus kaupii TaxID=118154 RepID=A0A9Q1EWN5_SYNKA|nr:hypothetical protein SKAU_G00278380 [Synaphobranchus kaupii]
MPVHYGTRYLPSFGFHVAQEGANLLDLDLFTGLGFSLRDESGTAILQVLPTVQQMWPALFDSLGCLTTFTHWPLVDPAVAPVIQPLRRLPLAFRDGVAAELTSLLEEGIIEPINTVPWVSNLVVSKKKTGGLHIGVDLRRVNKAVIPDRYPLPTSEELTTLFHGSKVFSKLDLHQGYLQVPLHPASRDLTVFVGKDEPWGWSPACAEAFCTLKAQLTTPPVLAHFNLSSSTLLTCDASAAAVGVVLSQVQDGVERPVTFASRALTPTEQRYSEGSPGPHNSALDFRFRPQATATVIRLRQYYYDLTFTPERDNVVADLLSCSIKAPTPSIPSDDGEPALIQTLYTPLQPAVSLEELKAVSDKDPILSTLRTFIRNGWLSHIPEELKPFARVKDELSCWADTCVSRGLCTVIQSALRSRILSMAHEGHLGIVKLKRRCCDLVWWPAIDREIEGLVRDCSACLLSGPPAPPPLQPLPWPSHPWEHVQLDICGEIHGHGVPHHQCFLVVIYDLHSKWPEVVPVGTVTSHAIIRILDGLFARWGLPKAVTTDNGPNIRLVLRFSGQPGCQAYPNRILQPTG